MGREIDKFDNQESREVSQLIGEIERLKNRLKESDQERITYLQNVAHQIVAPLNAMKWHIENLRQGRLGVERIQKVLRSVYSQATIAVHLAKNFALMSNLEGDHELNSFREQPELVQLGRLLVNLADDFQPLGWDRDIHISVNNDSFRKVPQVTVIKPLISQVFSNMIENAVKYSNPGTQIEIRGAWYSESNMAGAAIVNRGIGLRKEDIEHIWERGWRSPVAKEKYPAGTGFGLYIAKHIVDIHGGKVIAYTDQEGYTAFEVRLPIRESVR